MKYIFSLLFIGSLVSAQQYVLTKSTFSNAGGSSSSANYILKDAAGQSVTGESKATNYIEQAGFYTYSKLREVGIEETELQPIPKVFSLSNPFPNPIAKFATIKYGVPRLSHVSIKVYDITGRVVKTLISGEKKPGFYTLKWNSESDSGDRVAQGIYFIRMVTSDFTFTKKLVLLR